MAASIFSAVITSQRARPQPISRGSSAAWMTVGIPTLTSGMPNLASCAAIRKSQAAANSRPPPRHQPGIRAITGCRKRPHRLAEIAQAGNEFLRRGLIEPGHFLDVGAADHALLALAGDDQHANLPLRRQRLQPFANAVDDGRSEDIERAGVADRQANDAARIAVDAAMGIEHVHELVSPFVGCAGADRATSRAKRSLVKRARCPAVAKTRALRGGFRRKES